jgi:hypothetical protein
VDGGQEEQDVANGFEVDKQNVFSGGHIKLGYWSSMFWQL